MSGYFIVTPTKNEEDTLPDLIRSIEKQIIKPNLWVIVDESSDNTKEIIESLEKKYKWVKGIFLKKSDGYLGSNYGAACKCGFDFGLNYLEQHGIEYDYIGLIDADVTVEEAFFNKLIIKLETNSKLGIASGRDQFHKKGSASSPWVGDFPIGPAKLWRKKCFFDTNGYQPVAAADSVSNIKAKLKGWEIRSFEEIHITVREHATAKGYWSGYTRLGRDSYFLNYNPILISLKALRYSLKKPYFIGIALFYGYLNSFIHNEKKIEDNEIKNYFMYVRPKEILNYYIVELKSFFVRSFGDSS